MLVALKSRVCDGSGRLQKLRVIRFAFEIDYSYWIKRVPILMFLIYDSGVASCFGNCFGFVSIVICKSCSHVYTVSCIKYVSHLYNPCKIN